MKTLATINQIQQRQAALREMLSSEAPHIAVTQLHLRRETEAHAYWNFGYLIALSDILSLLTAPEERTCTSDMSS